MDLDTIVELAKLAVVAVAISACALLDEIHLDSLSAGTWSPSYTLRDDRSELRVLVLLPTGHVQGQTQPRKMKLVIGRGPAATPHVCVPAFSCSAFALNGPLPPVTLGNWHGGENPPVAFFMRRRRLKCRSYARPHRTRLHTRGAVVRSANNGRAMASPRSLDANPSRRGITHRRRSFSIQHVPRDDAGQWV